MLVLVCLLIMMMTTVKSDASPAEIITAHSGEAVLLTSDLQEAGMKHIKDIRWTHPHLVISLLNNLTKCHHGRCELLRNGSLRFSRVQTADSGNYRLQVFDERGNRLKVKEFLLRVDDISSSKSKISVVVVLISCFLLLLVFFFIILFIVMRRRSQRKRTATGPLQESIYEVMHRHHSNNRKEEEKLEREEESHYVPCNPVVSMETSITQMSADIENVYV